ncbi:Uncharacterized protein TCAP_05557, partial [Tolypocladium capitatum]
MAYQSIARWLYYRGWQVSNVNVLLGGQVDHPNGLDAHDALPQREKLHLGDVAGAWCQGPDARVGAEADHVGRIDHRVLLQRVQHVFVEHGIGDLHLATASRGRRGRPHGPDVVAPALGDGHEGELTGRAGGGL